MVRFLRLNRNVFITTFAILLIFVWSFQQFEPQVTVSILLSGLTLGALYFLVTSGLSLIFGMMNVLNFAHGVLFMFGAYIGYTLYANPLLLINILPFICVVVGGILVSSWVLRRWSVQISSERAAQMLVMSCWIGAGILLFLGVRGFDLTALSVGAATAGGGAIATEEALESVDDYAIRLILLTTAGLIIGVTHGIRPLHAINQQVRWRPLVLGATIILIGFALLPFRTSVEQSILGMSSNWRFVLALTVGALSGAAVGALIEWSLIRPLYDRPIYQILVTLGLVFAGTELVTGVWGPAEYFMETPAFFNQRGENCPSANLVAWFRDNCASIDVLGQPFPSYRLFLIALGMIIFIAIGLVLQRTHLGMIIRAGVQDGEMVQALGVNVRQVFTLVFAMGTGLAALGGVAAAPFIGVNPNTGQEFLLHAFIAMVIGGMGSYVGAAAGALLVGMARAFGDQLVLSGIHLPGMAEAIQMSPSIARASTVLIMVLVLLVRPTGLFGKRING
ncbi:MAG: branched-chain amino acid ABC transporter permease [Chloroflexota bacterium]